jgi:hypothetical protein
VGIGKIGQNKNLDVIGHLKTKSLQIPGSNPDGPSDDIEGFVLLSTNNSGIAGWISQSSLDDGDWTINGDDIYREGGFVGIGTGKPLANLHISSNIGNDDAEIFKVENSGVEGSGKTTIGKRLNGGPGFAKMAFWQGRTSLFTPPQSISILNIHI